MRCTMHESNIPTSNPPERPLESESRSIELAINHSITLDSDQVRKISGRILDDHGVESAEISIAIVDDPTIRELNRRYLNHDYATDVLSFVFDSDKERKRINGEVIVSADTAIRQASEHNVSTSDEIMLYIIHGMLHLVGLNDKEPLERQRMRQAEKSYAHEFGIDYSSPDGPESEGRVD